MAKMENMIIVKDSFNWVIIILAFFWIELIELKTFQKSQHETFFIGK